MRAASRECAFARRVVGRGAVGKGAPGWLLPGVALVWLLLLAAGPSLALGVEPSESPEPPVSLGGFQRHVDELLPRHGLDKAHTALLLFSTRHRAYLYRHAVKRPMIPASNVKLFTTYAALKELSPDFRWNTNMYLFEEHHDGGAAPRQGLLVVGSGDPTWNQAHLDRAALYIRSSGVGRLEAGIHFDGRLFDEVRFPASWGDVSRSEPWFAPVSPFIVNENVVEFLIAKREGTQIFDVFSPAPGMEIVSLLRESAVDKPSVRVEQNWEKDGATFTFQGSLAPAKEPYTLQAAVERPRVWFYRHLARGLRRAGVKGEIPLREGPLPKGPRRLIYSRKSPPLREVMVEVNKHSSNLTAEILLRTMGLRNKTEGVSSQDGLEVLREVVEADFPEAAEQLSLVDGSGLSRENRVTAYLMVRLLNRVRFQSSFRPEFVNSLSVAMTDGTLQYRYFPWNLRGRVRAKSGTLKGVTNLSGYLEMPGDTVIFSMLINHPGRGYQDLQQAQDHFLGDVYGALRTLYAPPATASEP